MHTNMSKQYLKNKGIYVGGILGGIIPLIGFLLSNVAPILFYFIFIPYYPLSFIGPLLTLITENESLIFIISYILLTIEYIVIGATIGYLLTKKKIPPENSVA